MRLARLETARLSGTRVLALVFWSLVGTAAAADGTALDALIRAYPEQLAGYDSTYLIWRDGTRMPLSDGQPNKSFEEMLRHGSILDQIGLRYPAGVTTSALVPQGDPGRIRNRAFFDKMYGDCWRGEVTPRLAPVIWLPQSWGYMVRATSVNGVAARLAEISAELDTLPAPVKRYVYPPSGTYNCRTVPDTREPSMHSWGARSTSTRLMPNIGYGPAPPRQTSYRLKSSTFFERHGFIWGGKWSHYDTMHFEYRPELVNAPPAAAQWATVPR